MSIDTKDNRSYFKVMFELTMKYGLIIGIYASLNILFLCTPSLGLFFAILSLLMALCFPTLIYYLTVKFRDNNCGGTMRYMQSVQFILLLFIFGTIVFSGGQYLIYQYLFRQSWFLDNIANLPNVADMIDLDPEAKENLMTSLHSLSPLTLMFTFSNWMLFFGVLYSFILSLFVKKS